MANVSLSVLMERLLRALEPNISFSDLSPLEQDQLLLQFQEYRHKETADYHGNLSEIMEYRVQRYITLYVPPVLLLVGLCGNFLSLCVLLNKSMIRQTTNVFFAALAFADSVVLTSGLMRLWIKEITGVDILLKSSVLCKAISMVTYVSNHFAVWLIIVVTIIRYIAVSRPHKASRYSTLKIAIRIIVILAMIVIIVNLHFIWTVELQVHTYGDIKISQCNAGNRFAKFIHYYWPWIDAVLFALAPFTLLVCFNIMIIIHISSATTWRRRSIPDMKTNRGRTSRSDIKVTLTLLTISISFLLTTLPMAVVTVLQNQWANDGKEMAVSMQVVSQRKLIRVISEMLMYMNHSINFFLYCAVGEKFREHLRRKFCKLSSTNISSSMNHSKHVYCSKTSKRHRGSLSSWL